jgi:hypothetical protein
VQFVLSGSNRREELPQSPDGDGNGALPLGDAVQPDPVDDERHRRGDHVHLEGFPVYDQRAERPLDDLWGTVGRKYHMLKTGRNNSRPTGTTHRRSTGVRPYDPARNQTSSGWFSAAWLPVSSSRGFLTGPAAAIHCTHRAARPCGE